MWGRPCLSSIAELPRGVDLVVFVVPARVVVRMIDDCGARGVRGIMVVSSGFAEAGEEGRALQAELRAAALRTKIPVLGPNVEGFVNYVDQVAPYGTTPPAEPVKGGISVISQSGTVAWTMNQIASDRAVGLRIILGVGNEAVLGLGDLFAWAAADPKTKVVTSYIETMRDVDGIGRGLDALLAARKPVVICAPEGRSEAALRSIIAHTGALAGNTGLRDAWLRGHGVVLVEDPVTMFETALLLSHVKKLRTDGVAAALQSGGACTLFAEAAGSADLPLPEFAAATKKALRKALPSFASQNNPLDVTGPGRGRDRHVRRRAGGAGEGSGRRARGVRRVPAAARGRDAVGRPGADQGDRAAAFDRRRVRVALHEPARLHRRGEGLHEEVEAAAVPAGAPGVGERDRRGARVPAGAGAGGARDGRAREPREGAPGVARGLGAGGRGDRGGGARAVRRAAAA